MVTWGILFLFFGASAYADGSVCHNLFGQLNNTPTLNAQIKQVREFEKKSLETDPETFVTNYNILKKILQIYKKDIGQLRFGMFPFTQLKGDLNSTVKRYLNSRKNLLMPNQKKSIEKVLESVEWVNSKVLGKVGENDLTAAYIPNTQTLYFEMPNHYKGTLIHAFFFFHEMEHAIQHIRVSSSFDNHDLKISDRAFNELKYLAELGAMTAEWTFLQGIADDEIVATIEQIKNAKDIERSYLEFFLRAFSNARLTLDQYIHAEHEAGRYSHDFFEP